MIAILTSIQPVIQHLRFVRINTDAIRKFCRSVQDVDFQNSDFARGSVLKNGDEEEQIAFAIVCSTMHFSYWGNPKWTIVVDGKAYDGSIALVRAFQKAVGEGIPLYSAAYLAKFPRARLAEILRGNVDIPLFNERSAMLQGLGRVVQEQYGGRFREIVRRGKNDAESIVALLVSDFSSVFNDVELYHGHLVQFYKRAQLVAAHLFDLYELGYSPEPIRNTNRLTAFADYKIPQLLRAVGILEYSRELASRIDALEEIPSGSDEEIEIRACTVWAAELIQQALKKSFPSVNALRVDNLLWSQGQKKTVDVKPYHRTRTIQY